MSNMTLIADYIKKHFPVEQMKYNMFIEDDIYYKIPKLVFRFSKEVDQSIYDSFKENVESFQGKIRWTIFESLYGQRVKNYILCPKTVYNMHKELFEKGELASEQEYFSEFEYKELCEKGIAEIPELFAHIKKNFNHDCQEFSHL